MATASIADRHVGNKITKFYRLGGKVGAGGYTSLMDYLQILLAAASTCGRAVLALSAVPPYGRRVFIYKTREKLHFQL